MNSPIAWTVRPAAAWCWPETAKTLQHLTGLFRDGRVQKFYLCLLDGEMKEPVIEVDAPLMKVQAGAERQIEVNAEGKPALTRFRRLQAYAGCTYAEAELLTGRTHQIRVHAQHIGMPLAGEARYASKESVKTVEKKGSAPGFPACSEVELRKLLGRGNGIQRTVTGKSEGSAGSPGRLQTGGQPCRRS